MNKIKITFFHDLASDNFFGYRDFDSDLIFKAWGRTWCTRDEFGGLCVRLMAGAFTMGECPPVEIALVDPLDDVDEPAGTGDDDIDEAVSLDEYPSVAERGVW